MKGTVSRHKEIKTMLRIDWEGILKNVLGFSEKRGRAGKEGIEGGKKVRRIMEIWRALMSRWRKKP